MRLKLFIAFSLLLALPLAQAADVETSVSPDCSYSALRDFVHGSTLSLHVASYTFTSPDIMQMLIDMQQSGVQVAVMVEKAPAGGVSDTQHAIMCTLLEHGIPVMMYDGELRYMHAKYIIRDGSSAMVMSENLGTTGFSADRGFGNRGWIAVVHDQSVSAVLLSLYDIDWDDSVPYACSLTNYSIGEWNPSGSYVPAFDRQAFRGQDVRLIYSPDSLDPMLSLIRSANRSIDAELFYAYPHFGSPTRDTIESAPNPMLEALLERARAGVRVRILLDSTAYNMDPDTGVNHLTMEYINSLAAEEGIPIEAKAIDLDEHGLEKVHNKGMVVDDRIALVSSINWNENSVMRNREVGVIIAGDSAGYYSDAFASDYGEVEPGYGLGFLPAMASLLALVLVVLYLSRRR